MKICTEKSESRSYIKSHSAVQGEVYRGKHSKFLYIIDAEKRPICLSTGIIGSRNSDLEATPVKCCLKVEE